MQLSLRLGASLAALLLAFPVAADAQVASFAPRATVFLEPSSSSKLLDINPNAELEVTPTDWLELHAASLAGTDVAHSHIMDAGCEPDRDWRLPP